MKRSIPLFCKSLVPRHNLCLADFKYVKVRSLSSVIQPKVNVDNIIDKISRNKEFEHFKSSPAISEKVETLFTMFPLCSESLHSLIINSPEVLLEKPEVIRKVSSLLLLHGDLEVMSEDETLQLFECCPDLLRMDVDQLEKQLMEIFGKCSLYSLPWHLMFIENPGILFSDTNLIPWFLNNLSEYFKESQIYNLVGNNPTIFNEQFGHIQEKMEYLMFCMHVSVDRISITRNSLTMPLDEYKTRHEFLLRTGHYKPPDPNQKGLKILEAEPHLEKISDTSDQEFVAICAHGDISIEEYNAFRTILYVEEEERNQELTGEHNLDEENFLRQEDEKFEKTYKGQPRSKTNSKKKQGQSRSNTTSKKKQN